MKIRLNQKLLAVLMLFALPTLGMAQEPCYLWGTPLDKELGIKEKITRCSYSVASEEQQNAMFQYGYAESEKQYEEEYNSLKQQHEEKLENVRKQRQESAARSLSRIRESTDELRRQVQAAVKEYNFNTVDENGDTFLLQVLRGHSDDCYERTDHTEGCYQDQGFPMMPIILSVIVETFQPAEVQSIVDIQNKNGDTALLRLVKSKYSSGWDKNAKLIEMLVTLGANPLLQDHDSRTALNITEAKLNRALECAKTSEGSCWMHAGGLDAHDQPFTPENIAALTKIVDMLKTAETNWKEAHSAEYNNTVDEL